MIDKKFTLAEASALTLRGWRSSLCRRTDLSADIGMGDAGAVRSSSWAPCYTLVFLWSHNLTMPALSAEQEVASNQN